MTGLLRALVVVLIALVAAWSVAQAAGTGLTAHEMAGMMAHDGHAASTSHCQGCEPSGMGHGAGVLCQIACAAPALADLTQGLGPAHAAPASTVHPPVAAVGLPGRSDPPDPFPPRALLI